MYTAAGLTFCFDSVSFKSSAEILQLQSDKLGDISRSNRYRRQLEEANKRAEDLLIAREKLMLAITHDFKAPLGSIMGLSLIHILSCWRSLCL